eukprot:gene15181-16743_t
MFSLLGLRRFSSLKSFSKLTSVATYNQENIPTILRSFSIFTLSSRQGNLLKPGKNSTNELKLKYQAREITKLTSFNVVDNSKLGQKTRRYKKPYLIGFYRKRKTADIGDVIKVAVQGRPCKALVVATRKPKSQPIPRFDNNNIVLLDDNLAPLGTRIKGPIPAILRKKRDKFSKVIALASRFV